MRLSLLAGEGHADLGFVVARCSCRDVVDDLLDGCR